MAEHNARVAKQAVVPRNDLEGNVLRPSHLNGVGPDETVEHVSIAPATQLDPSSEKLADVTLGL